jgi:pimeloyl-ACP methyl ester carboxylesterase
MARDRSSHEPDRLDAGHGSLFDHYDNRKGGQAMRFVLVHGGTAGAFCWEKLLPALGALDHEGVAMDLPGHGKRHAERSTVDGYCDAVLDVIEDGDVLVGNSLGACVVTLVADRVPEKLRHVIFLAGGPAIDGKPFRESATLDHSAYAEHVETPYGEAISYTFDGARHLFYNDCSPEDFERMYPLHTPQQIEPLVTPVSIPHFPNTDTPRSFILCTRDNTGINNGGEDFLERLRLDQAYLLDAGHFPFISRPDATAALFDRIARVA